MGRGSRSRAKRNKRLLKRIGLFAAIAACVCCVFGALAFVVASDNNSTCKEVGLKGGIAGCRRDKRYEYDNIYFVVGNTANTPVPYLSETALKYVRNSSLKKNPSIKIFSVASRDLISFKNNDEVEEQEQSDDTITRMQKIKTNLETAITKEPKSDGAQYYETIARAGQAIRSDSESNEKSIIIVIGSGLSDGGILNFSGGELLNKEPEEVESSLNTKNAIDDEILKGVRILWSGIGLTAAPQPELSTQEKTNIRNIYTTILKASGAAKLEFDDGANVDLPAIKTDKTVKTTPTNDTCYFCSGREFSHEELGFGGNESIIRDETKIAEISKNLEEDMRNSGGKTVIITGYRSRAYCGDEEESALPQQRADEVRDYIVSHTSISGDAIRAVSGGIGQYNECENSGTPDENLQKKNRVVTIRIER